MMLGMVWALEAARLCWLAGRQGRRATFPRRVCADFPRPTRHNVCGVACRPQRIRERARGHVAEDWAGSRGGAPRRAPRTARARDAARGHFEAVCRMARRLFGVANAFVSLIDADRQW